jgi:hypothetical protein
MGRAAGAADAADAAGAAGVAEVDVPSAGVELGAPSESEGAFCPKDESATSTKRKGAMKHTNRIRKFISFSKA